ncbi:hypothetical protein ABIB40_003047 [Pedobacter sp. UYP30]|uniref:hypothetical protein n=1 Tax=Pedobacter sp. UYP30 TaxID=1756400 RepID=UPI00339576A1
MKSRNKTERVPASLATAMVAVFDESPEFSECKSFTKAVWFPAKQILEIAKLLEAGTHDGLRIYFARYLQDQKTHCETGNQGKNTLLLVPTKPAETTAATVQTRSRRVDDIDEITNGGSRCPDVCGGTKL